MFKYTTAIDKLRSLKTRIKVVQGGTSAGKTFGIIPILIDEAIRTEGLEISIVSESLPHLRRGAMKDFLKIMTWTQRYRDDRWNRTLYQYTFSNGSFIEFFSADQPDKLRGARRDVLYVNEANNILFESYNQLSIRTRQSIWIDFNPTAEFWAHTELLSDSDSSYLKLTYNDNEALDASTVKEIEKAREKGKTSSYWANWWQVYGLGEIGNLEGVVFDNWDEIELPKEARLVGTGLDFGYTNDPSAIIDLYTWNDTYIFDEVLYDKEQSNEMLSFHLKKRGIVVCDSAEPKSIAHLRQCGVQAIGAKKGKDSIQFGIERMLNKRFYITSSSTNLIKEIRAYCWEVDRTNKRLNTAKGVDHAIDAARYIHTYYDYYKPGNYIVN